MKYRALDYAFSLVAPDPLAAELSRALRPLESHEELAGGDRLVISRTNHDTWSMTSDDSPTDLRALDAGQMLARVLEFVNQHAARSIDKGAPLHGATVVDGAGRAVALVGRSGAGKSTLAAAAVLGDWKLVAEEISVAGSHSLRVQPYHRPIGLRRGGAQLIGVTYPESADDLYSDVYPWPVDQAARADGHKIVAIALIDRAAGSSTPEIVRPAVALSELIEHMVVPDDAKVIPAFRSLEQIVRQLPTWRLPYTSVSEGLSRLEGIASAGAPHS